MDIAKQGTGLILRRNLEMEFEINKLIVDNAVTVAQVIFMGFRFHYYFYF